MQEQAILDRPKDRCPPAPAVSPAAPASDEGLEEAIGYHHAGRTIEAERLYRQILASDAEHSVVSYGLGLLCSAQGRTQEAIDAYRYATLIRPDFVDAYLNLGSLVLAQGLAEEALALYRQALAISPGHAMAHGNTGKALQDLGRVDEAIHAYREGIARQPDNSVIHVNLGAALLECSAWEEAITITERAISLQPTNPIAHANLGIALLKTGRYDRALAACREAVALRPCGNAINSSLGGSMLELGALEEAVTLCQKAIAADAAQPDAYFNLSHALKGLNRLAEAEAAAQQAIALCPTSAEYHFHLAHILLLQGNFLSGWPEYDWRLKLPDFAWIGGLFGAHSRPCWTGEDIGDKTVLIFTEQGLGDIIQFARYLPLVVQRARHVIVGAHLPARRLLETIEGITVVPLHEVLLQDFDLQCPLLSLPRVFATLLTTIPATVPYLRAERTQRERWRMRMEGTALRVGIVWAGNPVTRRDRFRSPGLSSVMPLFSTPGVDFIILQVGPGREDCSSRSWPPHVLDLGREVTDLAETAAIMTNLDLVISSCTGPLHLAGALGVPSWAMIPFAPHFPWLLEASDTRWYPTMRLYRQQCSGWDWSEVVGRIALDLTSLSRSLSATPSNGSRRFSN